MLSSPSDRTGWPGSHCRATRQRPGRERAYSISPIVSAQPAWRFNHAGAYPSINPRQILPHRHGDIQAQNMPGQSQRARPSAAATGGTEYVRVAQPALLTGMQARLGARSRHNDTSSDTHAQGTPGHAPEPRVAWAAGLVRHRFDEGVGAGVGAGFDEGFGAGRRPGPGHCRKRGGRPLGQGGIHLSGHAKKSCQRRGAWIRETFLGD